MSMLEISRACVVPQQAQAREAARELRRGEGFCSNTQRCDGEETDSPREGVGLDDWSTQDERVAAQDRLGDGGEALLLLGRRGGHRVWTFLGVAGLRSSDGP